uniref:Sugar phosphate isomerase/epimerase n=1 Tax=Candidatus Caldatribacterium californiense TaxID=1454726 RepID=A0A7V3YLF5_9BACT
MEWGISTFTYPWAFGIPGYSPERTLTLPELVERAAILGASVVQIAHNVPLHTVTREELETVKDLARRNHILLEVGTIGVEKESLLEYLDLAEFLGSRFVRTILDKPDKEIPLEEAIARIQDVLPLFSAQGVFLAIENHDRRTTEELRKLFTAIPDPYLRFCFDTANSLGAFENPREVLREFSSRTINVHLKDVDVFRPPHGLGFIIEGRPLGKGRLGVNWVFATLANTKGVTYIIELLTPFSGSVEETVRREEEWAYESAQFLKAFLGGGAKT